MSTDKVTLIIHQGVGYVSAVVDLAQPDFRAAMHAALDRLMEARNDAK